MVCKSLLAGITLLLVKAWNMSLGGCFESSPETKATESDSISSDPKKSSSTSSSNGPGNTTVTNRLSNTESDLNGTSTASASSSPGPNLNSHIDFESDSDQSRNSSSESPSCSSTSTSLGKFNRNGLASATSSYCSANSTSAALQTAKPNPVVAAGSVQASEASECLIIPKAKSTFTAANPVAAVSETAVPGGNSHVQVEEGPSDGADTDFIPKKLNTFNNNTFLAVPQANQKKEQSENGKPIKLLEPNRDNCGLMEAKKLKEQQGPGMEELKEQQGAHVQENKGNPQATKSLPTKSYEVSDLTRVEPWNFG